MTSAEAHLREGNKRGGPRSGASRFSLPKLAVWVGGLLFALAGAGILWSERGLGEDEVVRRSKWPRVFRIRVEWRGLEADPWSGVFLKGLSAAAGRCGSFRPRREGVGRKSTAGVAG